ncbi:hypothetical protein [Leptolyngbya sp. NK1-12]|nr:hypothetical protein [Leptolyngbya sp. NK1-12]
MEVGGEEKSLDWDLRAIAWMNQQKVGQPYSQSTYVLEPIQFLA